jgi:uncharacterized membrane protein
VRVIDHPLAFGSVVKAAFAKIRQSSNNNPAIVIRLFETFERLAPYLHLAEQKQAVVKELRATYESARNDSHVKADWEDIEASYRCAATALGVLADLPAAVAAAEPESGEQSL